MFDPINRLREQLQHARNRLMRVSCEVIDAALDLVPERRRPLAEPPAGSGLAAVNGNRSVPYVGDLLRLWRHGPREMVRRYETYGPVSWLEVFGKKMVLVAGGDAVQEVLANRDKTFASGWPVFLELFFTRGLLLLDGDEHMLDRRIMQRAFTRPRLEGYFANITSRVDDRVASWPVGRTIKLYPAIKYLSLGVAGEVFMGATVDDEAAQLGRAFEAVARGPLAILHFPLPGGKWNAGLDGRQLLERYFTQRISAKRDAAGDDIFSVLCNAETEDGERFSDQKIVDHMIFLIFAAHDTTSTTAATVAYCLGKYPEWQERARAESLSVGYGPLDLRELESLITLDRVIKESLRLVQPVPAQMRVALQDTEIQGHYIPKGTYISVASWVNQLLPEYWTEPDKFDPERFSPERSEQKSHKAAWAPFGGGVHKCIGMYFGTLEVKAILHAMLLNYEWDFPADYEIPWGYTTVPYPKDDLPVRLRRRKATDSHTRAAGNRRKLA